MNKSLGQQGNSFNNFYLIMEDEQKEILEGVIIDITNIDTAKKENLATSIEEILEKFPGDEKFSFKWFNHDPAVDEPIMSIATCDDAEVDGSNPKLYEYIYDLIYY